MSLIIDLENIRKNIKLIKEITKKELMVVQKSNAYELNSQKIIPLLKEEKIKWIVYNKYIEYLKDKEILDGFNILIMESVTLKNTKLPVTHTINNLDDALLISEINHKIKVHLQVDTGMNRIGIRSLEEANKIISILSKSPNIIIEGIYTHFSSNDNEYEYYNKQVSKFKEYLKLYPFKIIHSAATPSLTKEITGNMVRVGMAIYGYGNHNLDLHPSISFRVPVINSFKVKDKDFVGYNQKFKVTTPGYISVIPLGYDDIIGISELTKNSIRYSIVGKVCMNHLFIFSKHKINNLTKLNVLSKNDIISYEKYDWYLIITSMKKIPKNYLRRSNYDLPKVFNRTNQAYQKYQFRKRSN